MSSTHRNRRTAVLGLALVLASSASFALTVAYTASQGPKPDFQSTLPPVLSDVVAGKVNGFMGAMTFLGRNEFEGTTPTTGFSYNGGTASLSAGTATIVDGDSQGPDERESGRYNMTPGVTTGSNRPSFGHWLEATSSFTYSFSTAISAFGFYGTDFGDFSGTVAVDFFDGNSRVNTYDLSTDGTNGNLLFFGLASSDAFNMVTFRIAQSGGSTIDVLGFDSFIVGTANLGPTPAPEPGSLALVGVALAGLGATAARARRARQS